ncbi:hypothetical protein [Archaeoglobus sp.]
MTNLANIREIEERINKLRQKYGMDFDEFFELVESNIDKLLDRGFDFGEVLEDSLIWENLLDELDELGAVKINTSNNYRLP